MITHAVDGVTILNVFYPQAVTTGSAKRNKKPNKDGESTEWWNANGSAHPVIADRDRRYLAAYVAISRRLEKPIFAVGFPFEDDYLWLDRAVIATLLVHGCVRMERGAFVLTPKGEAIVQAIPVPSDLPE